MNLEVKTIIDCYINTFKTVSVSPRPLPRLAATWITLETPSRWGAILFDAISSTPTISNWAPYLANADFAISILDPRAVLISDFKFRIVGHKLNTSRQLPTLEHDNHFPTIGEQHGPLGNRLHLWPNEKSSAFRARVKKYYKNEFRYHANLRNTGNERSEQEEPDQPSLRRYTIRRYRGLSLGLPISSQLTSTQCSVVNNLSATSVRDLSSSNWKPKHQNTFCLCW